MSVYVKFTDDNSDSLTHYGVKGMKWRHRKGSIGEGLDQASYNYKKEVDNMSDFKKLRISTKTSMREGAKKTVRTIKKAGSRALNGASRAILNGKKHKVFQKSSRKAFDDVSYKLKDRAAKQLTVRQGIYNMAESATKKKRHRRR